MQLNRRGFLSGAAAVAAHAALAPGALAAARCPFPVLTAAGSPDELGRKHGAAFKDQIKHNLGFYMAWLKGATGADASHLLATARRFTPVVRRHLPHLLHEMQGIARGAGRSLDEILLLNARTDMLVMARAPRRAVKPGCTALALQGSRAGQPLLALGQNWDWRSQLAKGVVLLRLRPTRGPRLVTFTEAGMVGKIGFNQHRLGVCLNFLSHATQSHQRPFGVPVHLLLRAVMECTSLEQAFKLVSWVPRCASANFLMAQHEKGAPRALDLEWTPTATARISMRGGQLTHTNHFKDPALAPGCPGQRGKSTLNRDATAAALARALATKQRDPARRMRRVLAHRQGAPYAVSKTSAADSPSQTLAGIVMDLTRNRLHLVAGPPHKGRWVTVRGVG